jgi:hypothetical protein
VIFCNELINFLFALVAIQTILVVFDGCLVEVMVGAHLFVRVHTSAAVLFKVIKPQVV